MKHRHYRGVVSPLVFSVGCHLFQTPANDPPPTPTEPTPAASGPDPVALPAVESAPSETPAPEPSAEEPGVVQSGFTRGTLPRGAVTQVMTEAMPRFQACYEPVLARTPELRGTIELAITIESDGSVVRATMLESGTDLRDAGVIDCVLAEVQNLRFPEPRGGSAVSVYPLQFEPTPNRK